MKVCFWFFRWRLKLEVSVCCSEVRKSFLLSFDVSFSGRIALIFWLFGWSVTLRGKFRPTWCPVHYRYNQLITNFYLIEYKILMQRSLLLHLILTDFNNSWRILQFRLFTLFIFQLAFLNLVTRWMLGYIFFELLETLDKTDIASMLLLRPLHFQDLAALW